MDYLLTVKHYVGEYFDDKAKKFQINFKFLHYQSVDDCGTIKSNHHHPFAYSFPAFFVLKVFLCLKCVLFVLSLFCVLLLVSIIKKFFLPLKTQLSGYEMIWSFSNQIA